MPYDALFESTAAAVAHPAWSRAAAKGPGTLAGPCSTRSPPGSRTPWATSAAGAVSTKRLTRATREIRLALLEADVNFKVVKEFVAPVQEQALGQDVLKGLAPSSRSSRSSTTSWPR